MPWRVQIFRLDGRPTDRKMAAGDLGCQAASAPAAGTGSRRWQVSPCRPVPGAAPRARHRGPGPPRYAALWERLEAGEAAGRPAARQPCDRRSGQRRGREAFAFRLG